MFLDQPLAWTVAHGQTVAAAGVLALLLVAVAAYLAHRTSSTVLAAGLGAAICTGFSADTSWRFADHTLGMETRERAWLFAAGEIVLVVCAIMARANKRATATEDQAGTPGVPGVMVWSIAGVQVVPAFTESGMVGGLVRAVFGPVMAALLWHLAMGLEIRVTRPEALSTGLPAQIGHELRERLLSYLGLATRGRTAAQVSRDRATARAVRLASRRRLGWWGRAALKASVARSGAAVNAEQRHRLLQLLGARRGATALREMALPTPWADVPAPAPYPGTPLGVTGAHLRRLDPVDAVLQVHAAHPDLPAADLASLCTEYGVPVSETQVRIALHAAPPVPAQVQHPAVPEVHAVPEDRRPALETTGPALMFTAPPADPATEPGVPAVPDTVEYSVQHGDLLLDLATETEVRREYACAVPADMVRPARTRTEVHARVPDAQTPEQPSPAPRPATPRRRPAAPPAPGPVPASATRAPASEPVPQVRDTAVPAHPDPPGTGTARTRGAGTSGTPGTPDAGSAVPDELLDLARRVDADHRRIHGRPAPIRVLKAQLGVGQPRAERLRDALRPLPTARHRHAEEATP
ncbi:hypothetical protein ACIPEL_36245 [Streptomyces griseoviridis]